MDDLKDIARKLIAIAESKSGSVAIRKNIDENYVKKLKQKLSPQNFSKEINGTFPTEQIDSRNEPILVWIINISAQVVQISTVSGLSNYRPDAAAEVVVKKREITALQNLTQQGKIRFNVIGSASDYGKVAQR